MADFFRIEHHETHRGPYTQGDDLYLLYLRKWDWTENHPTPHDEGLWSKYPGSDMTYQDMNDFYERRKKEVCGFVNLAQFHAWFSEEMIEVIVNYSDAYVFARYEATNIRSARYQAVAHIDGLRRISMTPLDKLAEAGYAHKYEALPALRPDYDTPQRVEFMSL